jgi:hypothetical protein
MLVTHSTLAKAICFIVPILVLYNFLFLSLSLPRPAEIKQSIHGAWQDWRGINLSPPSRNMSTSGFTGVKQSTPAYVSAPSILDQFFASPNPSRKDFHEWNTKTLRDMHACMALKICGQNQMKVALLADNWIQDAVVRDFRGGEGIW